MSPGGYSGKIFEGLTKNEIKAVTTAGREMTKTGLMFLEANGVPLSRAPELMGKSTSLNIVASVMGVSPEDPKARRAMFEQVMKEARELFEETVNAPLQPKGTA